ncbi:RHS repeat protein [Catenulispora sp. NF23]|nr:RHS repeat protein [Catenulispora pinistramenti]
MADPVDVVSGWMLTDATDLELPGTLPVIPRRAYASGYTAGHLFGPGWSSTLDQRISINEAGIHFAGDDSQRLDYAIPAGSGEVLPQRGSRWPLVWDREIDELRITDPWSGQTRHFGSVHFQNQFGQIRDLAAISDRNGCRTRILRDDQGTPTLIEHPGYRIAVETVATVTGPRISSLRLLSDGSLGDDMVVRRYAYDERGRLAGVINSSGVPFNYEWDDHDRITAWRDRAGCRYGYLYDHLDRVVRGEGAFLAGSFRYDPADRTTVFTDSLGHITTFVYDEHGHVIFETDPLDNTTSTESDAYGRVLSRTDALGGVETLQRDDAGDVRCVIAADGSVVEFGHNRFHQVVAAVYPDGAEWLREYDERGNLTSVTDPSGAAVKFAYSGDGALTAVTDQVGAVTQFTNNRAGLSLSVLDPLGRLTQADRDSAGRVVRVTNPAGAITAFEWTVEGLPVARTGPDGARTVWHHDASGRLVQIVDPAGATTVFEPGPVETLRARTGPDGVRHTFAYDSELNLVEVGNPSGATWDYHYDAAGRLASETDFIGRTLAYEYDAAGRLATRTTRAGQQMSLERDAAGNVVALRTPDGDYTYSYDSTGHLISAAGPDNDVAFEYDPLGRVVAETVDGRAMHYGYDPAGRLVRRVTASGIESTWTYDAAGRPAALDAGDDRLTFRFDMAGREIERLFGAGASLSRGYDAAGRLITQDLGAGSHTGGTPVEDLLAGSGSGLHSVFSRTWVWRADGTPEELRDTLRGTTRRFTSDRAGRVTVVTAQGWTENYAYDAFGNATFVDADAGSQHDLVTADETSAVPGVAMRTLIRRSGRIHFEHDDAGRLIRTIRRTLDGRRRVWEYSWDAQDRLVQAVTPDSGTWRYVYDPLGRRSEKRQVGDDGSATEQTVFSWDGPRLAEQQTPGADGSSVTLTWDYDPGTYRPAAQRRQGRSGGDPDQGRTDNAFHAIITDLVGTPTELVTPDGHVAWHTTTTLWGRTISTSGEMGLDCPLRFPGRYHDAETGLHYNFHRYYDPDAAAYLTPDPLGLAPAPNDHAYTLNPLIIADPLGLEYEGAHYGEGFNTVNPDLPKPYVNPKGNWTNDVYTVRQQAMLPHMSGSTVDGKSQFLFNTEPEKITLDAAAYADAHGLWVGNKARVYIENGPVGIVGKIGELTNWIRVTREGRMVHSWPVGPPSSGG